MPDQPLPVSCDDLVTALAVAVAEQDASNHGYPWRGLDALYDEGRAHYLSIARAVLTSGLVRPAADSIDRQAVLDLAAGWERDGHLIARWARDDSVARTAEAFAARLRALAGERQ